MLAGDDSISLADLNLPLRGHGESGCSASFERHYGAAVTKAVAKPIVRAEIAGVYFLGRTVALLLEGTLFLLRIVENFLQITLLRS